MATWSGPTNATFPAARAALFAPDGRRVSEWEPVRADGSTGYMRLTETTTDPLIRIESADGVLLYSDPVFDAPRLADGGDSISFPGLTLR